VIVHSNDILCILWLAISRRLILDGGWIGVTDHRLVATSNSRCILLELGLICLFSSSRRNWMRKKKETGLKEHAMVARRPAPTAVMV
jgi:hypothetical protein